MQWANLQEAVRLAVATATGLVDAEINVGYPIRKVEWTNRSSAAKFLSGPCVFLHLRSPRGVGVDETRREYDADTDANVVTQCGVRVFTVSVRIENDSQTPGEESVGALASLLRTRLRRGAVLGALQTAGIALMTIERTVDADYREPTGRWVSASVTDLQLSAAENDLDTTDAGDFIESVEGSGEPEIASVVLDVDAP